MPRNSYHWALHITPKPTSSSTHNNVKPSPTIGTRHHATNKLLPRGESGEIKSTWVAESHPLSDLDRGSEGAKLLVKVLIGKIVTLGGREEVDGCIAKVGVLQDVSLFFLSTSSSSSFFFTIIFFFFVALFSCDGIRLMIMV